MRNGHFAVRRVQVSTRGYSYWTYKITGWLRGRRVRLQFSSQAEADGALQSYEIQAANAQTSGLHEVRPINTRLSPEQIREAEAATQRLGGRSLSFAVDWFLEHYRPPVVPMALSEATKAFRMDRQARVSFFVARDYKRELTSLETAFPGREAHAISTDEMEAYLVARKLGPKSWNNLRGILHAFFEWCCRPPRQWCSANPIRPLPVHRVARGIPAILTATKAAELMAFLETYPTGTRQKAKPGYLVPYFALCLFAGVRPAVPRGETWKLGKLPREELARAVDLQNGVVRIGPAISKTRDLRQVMIQPNLHAWLERYPLTEFPIVVPAMQWKVQEVRKRFGLSDDILRHTFCSMHVAKFKSLGGTALEAGNSERIIRRHYLNMVTGGEAQAFWQIVPASHTASPAPGGMNHQSS